MTRVLAFTLLALAAFDWPAPWLDRLGTAALGLAFLSLSVGATSGSLRRALPFGVPTKTVAVADETIEASMTFNSGIPPTTVAVADEAISTAASLAQRIAAYDEKP